MRISADRNLFVKIQVLEKAIKISYNAFEFKLHTGISKGTVTVSKPNVYSGKKLKPTVTVRYSKRLLKNETDYKLSYKNNKKAVFALNSISRKTK